MMGIIGLLEGCFRRLRGLQIVNPVLHGGCARAYGTSLAPACVLLRLRRWISGGQKSRIRLGGDLAVQFARSPAAGNTFVHVPFAGRSIRHTHENAVVRPTQFVTHCVTNWKSKVELTHVLEICGCIAVSVFSGQAVCQPCNLRNVMAACVVTTVYIRCLALWSWFSLFSF